jgi:hypothetical protein
MGRRTDVAAGPRPDDGAMDFLLNLLWSLGIGLGATGALLLVAGVLLGLVDGEAAA